MEKGHCEMFLFIVQFATEGACAIYLHLFCSFLLLASKKFHIFARGINASSAFIS